MTPGPVQGATKPVWEPASVTAPKVAEIPQNTPQVSTPPVPQPSQQSTLNGNNLRKILSFCH